MKTALITGATEGIGYAFSQLFARDGYALVLVARNEQKLQEMVKSYEQQQTKASYYAVDLSDLESVIALYHKLQSDGVVVDCLVNNAGFGLSGLYTDLSWEDQFRMFQLDMMAVAYLSHAIGQEMKARGNGKLLNVASTAAFMPLPNMAGYGASKSFVLSLSDALNTELRPYGVSVTTLCPGVTRTKFHEVAHTEKSLLGSHFLPQATPEEVAAFGYKAMMKGKPIAIHQWMNRLEIGFVRIAPKCLVRKVLNKSLEK